MCGFEMGICIFPISLIHIPCVLHESSLMLHYSILLYSIVYRYIIVYLNTLILFDGSSSANSNKIIKNYN